MADGGSAIDPKIVSALMQRRRSENPLTLLTPREREVLELMATGTSNQGIADQLVITTRAIEKYVSSIFDKLGIPSTRNDSRRVMAVLLYLRHDRLMAYVVVGLGRRTRVRVGTSSRGLCLISTRMAATYKKPAPRAVGSARWGGGVRSAIL